MAAGNTMDQIVGYLSGVFKELAEGVPYSDLLQLNISDAPARVRAQRLLIAYVEEQGRCTTVGLIKRWWVADDAGLREDAFPLSQSCRQDGMILLPFDFHVTSPQISFRFAEGLIWLTATFGTGWHRYKVAQVNATATIDVNSLRDA